MEPRIQYATSVDGTRIAVGAVGEGRPLVILPSGWLTSIEVYWQIPETRANLERLAARRKVVIYDIRGAGLSERDVTDLSFEARVGDLAAVVDHLDAPVVDLLPQALSAPAAICYAAKNPERVGRLILVNAVARGRDLLQDPRQRALRHLIEVDWELYAQNWALIYFGWTELGRRVAEAVKNLTSAEIFLTIQRALNEDDVRDLLPQIRCPTLVMTGRDNQTVSREVSKQITAAIPNSRFGPFDQEHPLTLGAEAGVRVIEGFLEEEAEQRSSTVHPEVIEGPSGTAIILFADIVDSTALTETLGDAAFRDKARDLDASLRAVIRENTGTPIEGKLLGDGVLAVFSSARQAIEAALACGKAGSHAGLPLHLGLHAGDVIRESDPDGRSNVYGGAVNIASRISGLSAPGEVLVSDTVRGLARTSAGVTFEDRGEQALKGVGEPVRVWAVRDEEARKGDINGTR